MKRDLGYGLIVVSVRAVQTQLGGRHNDPMNFAIRAATRNEVILQAGPRNVHDLDLYSGRDGVGEIQLELILSDCQKSEL
jgi:hypothetical protein